VINVTWKDAKAYCEWLASETGEPYRLPTEAEWEYACRAGTTTKFAFGDSMSTSLARYGLRAWSTAAVGSYRPNLWGLFDMHGNVYEWVQDVWHEDYEGAPNDGSAWLDGGVEARRVARGGAYVAVEASLVQSGYRTSFEYMASQNNLGFRLARAL
jgi:formylglycine-generating enzyme required for sulfatase activity